MKLQIFIGYFFRTRARVYSNRACLPAGRFEKRHERIVLAIVFAVSFFVGSVSADEESFFLRGKDARFHSVRLNRTIEQSTRQSIKFSNSCIWVQTKAVASPLSGTAESTIDPSVKAKRGVIVLEGLIDQAVPRVLYTTLLSTHKNYPMAIPGETAVSPDTRYPLAITLAAQIAGKGDLILKKGDTLTVHAGGQLYTYALPTLTIPNGGVLRLYLGTDDGLYYDAALKHSAHAGVCGSKKG